MTKERAQWFDEANMAELFKLKARKGKKKTWKGMVVNVANIVMMI